MGVWPYFLGVSGYEQEAVGGARNKVNRGDRIVLSRTGERDGERHVERSPGSGLELPTPWSAV